MVGRPACVRRFWFAVLLSWRCFPAGSDEVMEARLDMEKVLADPQGEKAIVKVLHDVLISCKGQVFSADQKDLTSPWPGCKFSGTCVWNSSVVNSVIK
jgi:hypothetical protein